MLFVVRYGFTKLSDFWYSPQLSFDHAQPQMVFPSLASFLKAEATESDSIDSYALAFATCQASPARLADDDFFLKTMFEDHLRMRMIKGQQWKEWRQCDSVYKGWEHIVTSWQRQLHRKSISHFFPGGLFYAKSVGCIEACCCSSNHQVLL